MTALARVRHFWGMTRKKPPVLRSRYARASVDRRLVRVAGPLALARVTDASRRELAGYVAEVGPGSPLHDHVRAVHEEYSRLSPGGATGTVLPTEAPVLYALVRALEPEHVVETGTANGLSTAYILEALARNGRGRLLSVDFPSTMAEGALAGKELTPLPPGKEPGWMVPEGVRERWELRLGRAEELLEPALDELGSVDVFLHDSLHTREHMLFELRAAWRRLTPGGVAAADDIYQRNHDAFHAFAVEVGAPMVTFGNLGFVRKR